MSYCRWSSDNWKCDVYCYEHVHGGFQIHVAAKRISGDITPLDWSTPERLKETHDKQCAELYQAEHVSIGLDYDGQSFSLTDAEECLGMMQVLRDVGYTVPQYAIDSLKEEAEEEQPSK